MSAPPKKAPPYFACSWEVPDAAALQALAAGTASEDQQRRALDWIINQAAGTYDVSFQPGLADATAFHEGRRFVGLQVVKLLKLNLRVFRKDQEHAS